MAFRVSGFNLTCDCCRHTVHITHRVVFQNLECLQRFGPPRSMASNAELLANTEGQLSSEQHALWCKWHIQLMKVAPSKLPHAQCCMHCASCNVLHALSCLLAACLGHTEHAQAVLQALWQTADLDIESGGQDCLGCSFGHLFH